MEKDFFPFKYTVSNKDVERILFIKQHVGNEDVKPSDRTLYVLNVPQFLTQISMEELFKKFGKIEKVFIQSKPSSGLVSEHSKYFLQNKCTIGSKVCYIVFEKPSSVKKALKYKTEKNELPSTATTFGGKEKWIKDYNSQFVNSKELLSEIETYMSEFDKKLEEEKMKDKEIEGVADEEGWVTVTKQSKKPKISRNEFTSKRLMEKQKRAQAKLTLVNFYKCQLQNAKMDQMLELQKKFENDKKRVALMKANRKFKPY